MEKHQFQILINAPREKVWEILWGKDTYPQWIAPFSPGSNVFTDWKKGSKVIFGDGSGDGMVSRIAETIPNEFMSFEHLGEVKDGVEDTESEKVKAWAGSHENYTLKTVNGGTDVTVDMDISEEYAEMFKNIWPNALAVLKELAEKG
ncbi:MAG: SRPBCC domain-containing protein [Taibaiella sp.]|nr:SRPBCC domain-containing protein [Taibaiella sp.]